ncbi:MAG: HDOD domain-containing protein [Planctomycetota bacterium]
MGPFSKIREHFALASGNFARLFKEVEIPQLPEAVACLITEFNQQEPDIPKLTRIISSDIEISTKIIRTVNSALYGLPNEVKSIQSAITLLGLRSIRTIALSYSMRSSIPSPKGGLFDQDAFWTDSLIRALMARSMARKYLACNEDEAFTVSLLSDVALPVLLSVWNQYYEPIVDRWKSSCQRLSRLEQENFGWDHAQAGAWILKSWEFPDELVSLVSVHNLSIDGIRELGLDRTVALPVATAALLPSVLRHSEEGCKKFMETALVLCSLKPGEFAGLVQDTQERFNGIREQFGINAMDSQRLFDSLLMLCDPMLVENAK